MENGKNKMKKIIWVFLYLVFVSSSLAYDNRKEADAWNYSEAGLAKAIGKNPKDAELYFKIGFLKENRSLGICGADNNYCGDYYQLALPYYQKAVELNPAHPEANFRLALMNDYLGQRDKAIDILRKYLQLNPKDVEARAYLGKLGKETKEKKEK